MSCCSHGIDRDDEAYGAIKVQGRTRRGIKLTRAFTKARFLFVERRAEGLKSVQSIVSCS